MERLSLNSSDDFIVGEDKVLNRVMALLFFGLFAYGLVDAILQNFYQMNYLNAIFFLSLGPSLYFFGKSRSPRIYLRVNSKGIYQDEELVTDWRYFLDAYVSQEKKTISIRDNFILLVEYQKPGEDKGYRRKIKLTNTQNKSEEEVIAAIRFFWKDHNNRKSTITPSS